MRRGKLDDVQSSLLRPLPAEELYDLETDPYEIHNLATSADPRRISRPYARLRAALDTWIVETDDHGRNAEPRRSWRRSRKKCTTGSARRRGTRNRRRDRFVIASTC